LKHKLCAGIANWKKTQSFRALSYKNGVDDIFGNGKLFGNHRIVSLQCENFIGIQDDICEKCKKGKIEYQLKKNK